MAEISIYVILDESKSSGYITLEEYFLEGKLKDEYISYVDTARQFNYRAESFDGFHLRYMLLKVKYDGRRGLKETDVMTALEKDLFIRKVGEGGIFGAYYVKTEKLARLWIDSMTKRKVLAGMAK